MPTMPLPPEVAGRLGPFYVYVLVDPRTDVIFYVGKGTGTRLLAHGIEADLAADRGESRKLAQIRAIRQDGLEPRIDVVRYGLTEPEALTIEAALIDCVPGLSNKVSGHGPGRESLAELATRFGASPLTVTDPPVLMIRLRGWTVLDPPEELEPGYVRRVAGWRQGVTPTELLDAVRGWWAVSPRTCDRLGVRHAVAVAEGVTRGIYEIGEWVGPRDDGDYAFTATPINRGPLWESYVGRLGRRVPFTKNAQNPILYWPRQLS